MPTKQEIFTQVKDHLLKQGCKSQKMVDGTLICAYRGDNGCKCAAGCLIPDDMYDPDFENISWNANGNIGFADMKFKLNLNGYDYFIRELQGIHDSYDPTRWEERLRVFAEDHMLQFDTR